MNPHTHDYRDTVRAGEKTGDPFQAFPRRTKVSPWLFVSSGLAVIVLGLLMVFLPESAPW